MSDHYEALFDKNYLRWFHLEGKPALIRILGIRKKVDMTMRGGKKDKKPVLDWELLDGSIKEVKPLVLNKTNSKMIGLIHGEMITDWIGKEVVLYEDKTEMYDQDLKRMTIVNCIRVRAKRKVAEPANA